MKNKNKNKIYLTILTLLVLFVVITPFVYAAEPIDFSPVTDIPLLDSWTPGETINASVGAENVFNQIFSLSIRIGAMLAVFMFIWGGLNMIMARDNASNITRGKEKMKNAIFGLLMLLSTFIVLNTINPDLVDISLFGDGTVSLDTTRDTEDYYRREEELQNIFNERSGKDNTIMVCDFKNRNRLKCYDGNDAVNKCLESTNYDATKCEIFSSQERENYRSVFKFNKQDLSGKFLACADPTFIGVSAQSIRESCKKLEEEVLNTDIEFKDNVTDGFNIRYDEKLFGTDYVYFRNKDDCLMYQAQTSGRIISTNSYWCKDISDEIIIQDEPAN